MSIHVEPMTPESLVAYERLLLCDETSMVYASSAHFEMLQKLLPEAEGLRLVAKDSTGQCLGGLTFFIRNGPLGPVANAQPFFGSPCGLFVPDHAMDVEEALLGRFQAMVRERGCIASTFITSPQAPDPQRYHAMLKPDFVDTRIGLITPLPPASEDISGALMSLFLSKTRNMVRKGLKGNFRLDRGETGENWEFLQRTHEANMAQLNGATRPPRFFQLMQDQTAPGIQKRLYTAYLGETPVAGLLLLLHHRTVDYFVPVIDAAHRSAQPLSFLIMNAMQDAVALGYRWWNWGGTSLSQKTLYHFKTGFGAKDHPYYYLVHVYDPSLLKADRKTYMREYPFFYAYPYT